MLKIENLFLRKNAKILLQNINVEFSPSSITLLLGPSGAGKSTLLRCLAEIETNYEGAITFESYNLKELSPRERSEVVSFIAQSYVLFPHLTVLQNCIQPLQTVKGKTQAEAQSIALSLLIKLGMENYLNSYPSQLSGGQQRRVAIARALAINPKFLLLDEPTSALDPSNTTNLVNILKKLQEQGKGIVIATQDMSFADQLNAERYYLEKGVIMINDPPN